MARLIDCPKCGKKIQSDFKKCNWCKNVFEQGETGRAAEVQGKPVKSEAEAISSFAVLAAVAGIFAVVGSRCAGLMQQGH